MDEFFSLKFHLSSVDIPKNFFFLNLSMQGNGDFCYWIYNFGLKFSLYWSRKSVAPKMSSRMEGSKKNVVVFVNMLNKTISQRNHSYAILARWVMYEQLQYCRISNIFYTFFRLHVWRHKSFGSKRPQKQQRNQKKN